MNIRIATRLCGSILLLALLTAVVLSLTLATLLSLTFSESRIVSRSLVWNSDIPMADAGVEEALTHLYYVNGTNGLGTNGWSMGADGFYHKSRSFASAGSYDVLIQPVDPPIIVSTARMLAPIAPSYSIARRIRVSTTKLRTNGGGLTAKKQILFSGGGILDSFDSSDPNFSTSGRYDAAKRKDGALAQTNLKTSDAVHVDTAHIYGTAVTGPGGTVTCNSGAVGDAAWDASHSGIETGHSRNDANLDFPDNPAPFNSALPPLPGIVGLTNYTYVLGDGNYELSSVNVGGGKSMAITGNAVLYVTGNFTVVFPMKHSIGCRHVL